MILYIFATLLSYSEFQRPNTYISIVLQIKKFYMKIKSILKSAIIFCFIILANSCSKSSDNEPNNTDTNQLTSITLTSSVSSIILESQGYFTLSILGNDNVNYTTN